MGKLPILSGKEVCRILERHGFSEARRKGSHIVMQRMLPNTTITVPIPIIKKFALAHCFLSFGNQACNGQSLHYKKSSNKIIQRTVPAALQASVTAVDTLAQV